MKGVGHYGKMHGKAKLDKAFHGGFRCDICGTVLASRQGRSSYIAKTIGNWFILQGSIIYFSSSHLELFDARSQLAPIDLYFSSRDSQKIDIAANSLLLYSLSLPYVTLLQSKIPSSEQQNLLRKNEIDRCIKMVHNTCKIWHRAENYRALTSTRTRD